LTSELVAESLELPNYGRSFEKVYLIGSKAVGDKRCKLLGNQ
jgi:hypothetical protein